jgi:hypothetical protein
LAKVSEQDLGATLASPQRQHASAPQRDTAQPLLGEQLIDHGKCSFECIGRRSLVGMTQLYLDQQ